MWARSSHWSWLAAALLLGACAAGPDFVRPAVPGDTAYVPASSQPGKLDALGQAQQLDLHATLAADWWRLFGSPSIDMMVDTALAGNPGIQGAEATLRESQDNLRAGYGVFFPQVGIGVGATRQRETLARLGLSGAGSIFNLFTLGPTISYALDLFGAQRRTVEGLRATTDYQRYMLLAADITLTGNVINTAIAREAYAEQMEITQGLIDLQRDQLAITRTRADAGTVPYSAVASVRSALATTEAALPALEQHRDQADHLLSTLLGHTTGQGSVPGFRLDALHLPGNLPLSLPSDLVRQRPDILAAEAQLHVANANIGVATAALFPSFSLNGSYGTNGNTVSSLSQAQSKFWSAGVSGDWQVFQGGSAWFNRKAAQEAYSRSLSDYRQAVLGAFEQVADSLKALQHDALELDAQSEAMQASQEALKLTQANYAAGIAGYLDVLSADQQYQQSRLAYVQVMAQRYQDTVGLYVALGGGWWNATPPTGLAGSARGSP
jgi:NodT family efflux transporter outer membrane factor (OMF) lipoprotein